MILVTTSEEEEKLRAAGFECRFLSERDMGWVLHRLKEIGDKVSTLTDAIEEMTSIKGI